MTLNIGDHVRVNSKNDYDENSGYNPAESFAGLEGHVVKIERELIYVHLDAHHFHLHVTEDNPWPFYAYEVDRV